MKKVSRLKLYFCVALFILAISEIVYAYTDGTQKIQTPHFVIEYEDDEYDPDGNPLPNYATPNYVNNVETVAEEAWNYIIGQGYKRPPGVPESDPIIDYRKKVQINIMDLSSEDIYGDCSSVGKDSTDPPTIRVDNNYLVSEYPTWNGDSALRTTVIHEFFHAIQQAYASLGAYRPSTLNWFWEGTASWTQDENVVLLDENIDDYNHYNILPNRAKQFMETPSVSLTPRSYDAVLFWIYFSEKGYSIKTVLEKYDTGNYTSANHDDMFKAMREAMGGADKLRDLYNDFSIACFMKTGSRGFSDDGAKGLPNVKVEQTYDSASNAHYQAGPPTTIGQKIDDCTDTSDNFPQRTDSLPRLSAHYIKYELPAQVSTPTQLKSKMYAHVDGLNKSGSTDLYWGANICSITNETPNPNDPSKNRKFIEQIALENANRKNMSSGFEIGGDTTTVTNNKEIYLIVANLEGVDEAKAYKYSSVISPVFQESYTPDTKNGTTKTVKCLDEDNLYGKGNTIKMEIDLSGQVDLDSSSAIEPDFSAVDSGYNKERLTIAGAGGDYRYVISYKLSDNNTVNGKDLTIPIKAYDLTKQDYNEDKSFKVIIDTTPPFLEVKDSEGKVIPDGGFTNKTSISIFVDDYADGSGIDKLEVRKGSASGSLIFSDDTDYGQTHNYSVSNLPEGEIYVKAIDKAQNYTLHHFIIDTTPPEIIFSLNGTAVKNNAGAYSPPVTLTYAAKDNLDPEPKIVSSSHPSPTTFTKKGSYTVTVTAKDKAGNEASKGISFTISRDEGGDGDVDNSDPTYIQLSRQAPVDAPEQTPYQFSPQASPGVKDTLDIDYNLKQNSLLSILIYDSNNKLVRALINNQPRNAGSHIDIWDGKDDSGEFLPEGNYRFIINAVNSLNPLEVYEITGDAIIDNTLPQVSIDLIKADTPQYGHYTAIGSAADTHLEHYLLENLQDTTPTLIERKNIEVKKDILTSFNGFSFKEGAYTLRLSAKDFAGNSSISETPLIVDRTHNGLKAHINSLSKISDVGDEGFIPTADEPNIWVDDELPLNSTAIGNWQWSAEFKYSGQKSHTDSNTTGTQGHYFIHSDKPLVVKSGDNIIQYVYLDPNAPPQEILLQFYAGNGDGEHRVYWGQNYINSGGQNGTASLFYMGGMPQAGKWLRLKIPVDNVGLADKEIKGMAFVTYNGGAYWDKTTSSLKLNETQESPWVIASLTMQDNYTHTIIYYYLSQARNLALKIYDRENNLITTLFDTFQTAGNHQIVWDEKDSLGRQAPDGRYYFQFSATDGPIDSNSFSIVSGDFSGVVVVPKTSVTDSEGNTYTIDLGNKLVNKYDAANNLIFAISGKQVARENFDPAALELDNNDNLFIADKNNHKIFKLEPHSYYLMELPFLSPRDWEDGSITLDRPVALLVDDKGDMFISNKDGDEVIKLAVARGVIEISNIIAEIRIPYEDALVYATVPIIGTASARNFVRYKVDYGVGVSPSVWTTLNSSTTEVFDDHKPLPGAITLQGNLATWSTYNLPMGVYSLRLLVYTQDSRQKQDIVRVEVARDIHYWGGIVASSDGLVTLTIPKGGIGDDVELFSIKPVSSQGAPAINNPELTLIGKIYEFKPSGLKFLKPCQLKMYYNQAQLGGVSENSLKIYRWNPVNRSWVYVYADLDIAGNVLTTELTEFSDYQTFYAIMADPPPAPALYQPTSPTMLRNIIVYGKAAPSVKVELFVNNVSCGTVKADVNTGYFVKYAVPLIEGDNYITAQASDPVGNKSEMSQAVLVKVLLIQPAEVSSLSFKTSDFSQDFMGEVSIGEELYLELVGLDANSSTVDSATVTLKSSLTDPVGINIQLLETEANSAVYRGVIKVGAETRPDTIGVSQAQPETITAVCDIDRTKQDSVNTRDILSPPAPVIFSPTHPSLAQDTFEVDLGQWANKSGNFGATVERTKEAASSGEHSLKLTNQAENGDFASYIRTTPFDAQQYPIVGFDYKIPEGVKINLIAYVNGMWKEIVFTDEPKSVKTFAEDLYRTVGASKGVAADNQWHHAEFNLYNMLKNDDPAQEKYMVEEFFLANYDLTGWMELVMGHNPAGATYYIDNFIISESGKANKNPEFTWEANDTGVNAYSYLLDTQPATIPDEISEGGLAFVQFNALADGTYYFHLRSRDAAANWGPVNHYRIMIDTIGAVADMPEPLPDSSSGSQEIKLRISDAGTGVDPETMRLKINDTTYDMVSGGMSYDAETKMLNFSLWKVKSIQEPWQNGSRVTATLLAANDYAGNSLVETFSWSWRVDYSKLTGGYLSLLTTEGGYTPTWSADGKKLAFMSERSGNQDIWVMDSDDYAELKGSARQLTSESGENHHPDWSPIDNRIVFVSNRNGVDNLWLINADGSGLTQLTHSLKPVSHPSWSPDALRIAFSRSGEIWLINADGTNETRITNNPVENNLEPAWSSDGSKLAFLKSLYVDTLWRMDIDGGNEIALTSSGRDNLPAWSSQSERIFFVTTRDDAPQCIWLINSNGSGETSFIENNGMWWDSQPSSSPVDEKLAFQSTRNGMWNIWVMTDLNITDAAAIPEVFSPNNDGIKDTTDIKFNLLVGGVEVSLKIYDSSQNLIRTLLDEALGVTAENKVAWDGKNDSGEKVSDGTYTYKITVAGNAGAKALEKSGTVNVDTAPPSFSNWIIPDINVEIFEPQNIAVTLADAAGVNTSAVKLQYGIAASMNETTPTLVNWTDFASASIGTLDLSWWNYPDKYLYVRGYAEDNVGNAAYSEVQKEKINSVIIVNQPPACAVMLPNGGEIWSGIQNIKWSASDVDEDALTITIDYSNDGGLNWVNIASGLTNYGSYSWDTRSVGDSRKYLIRVGAFDGVTSTQDQSDNLFTVDNTPPSQIITLTAVDANISETINLDWTGYSEPDDLAYYKLYHSETDFSDVSGMSAIANVAKGTFNYQVAGLTNGKTYYFAITAIDRAGNEERSVTTASAIPTTGKGTIEITSTPEGAKVYLSGNYGYLGIYQGIAPITIPEVKEGKYVLQLSYPGYQTYYQFIEVLADKTTTVTAPLVETKVTTFAHRQKIKGEAGDLNVGNYSLPFVVDWNMDGLKDLVVGNGNGDIIFYQNTGKDDSPLFTTGATVIAGIADFVSVFVVDWNNDHQKDLIVGDSNGYVKFYANSGTDSAPLFTTALDIIQIVGDAYPFVVDWNNDANKDLLIGDGNGNFSLYLNTATDQSPSFDSLPSLVVTTEVKNAISFVVADWDSDGDKDLIIGDKDGYLNLYLNSGTDDSHSPVFTRASRIQARGEDLRLEAGYSTPFVVDYNNDAMTDFLIGDSEGHLSFYQASLYTPTVTQIALQPSSNQYGWHNLDPAITLTATDNEGGSGVREIHYTLTGATQEEGIVQSDTVRIYIHNEGTTNLTYYAIDNEWNIEAEKHIEIRLDRTPPTIEFLVSPQPNSYGWNDTDVTISFSAADAISGVATITAPVAVITEGAGQYIGGEAVDIAGNKATTYVAINIDKTPPTITATVSPKPNSSGWNKTPVTVSFTATDNLSGIASVTPPITMTTDGANQKIVGEAIDLAGNKANASVILNLDKTPPKISLELKPVKPSKKEKHKEKDKGNRYELIYSAIDELSGLKNLQAGLVTPDITGFSTKLTDKNPYDNILIDTKKKRLIIKGPHTQELLQQLKNRLLLIPNNQQLHLEKSAHHKEWDISKKKPWKINAPAIIFKAQAADNAGNVSTKQLEYKKKR